MIIIQPDWMVYSTVLVQYHCFLFLIACFHSRAKSGREGFLLAEKAGVLSSTDVYCSIYHPFALYLSAFSIHLLDSSGFLLK